MLWLVPEAEAAHLRERILDQGLTIAESRDPLTGLGTMVGLATKIFAVDDEQLELFFQLCEAANWQPEAKIEVKLLDAPVRAIDEFLFLPQPIRGPGGSLVEKLRYIQIQKGYQPARGGE